MALHEETLQKETVLHVLEDAKKALQHDDVAARDCACEALQIGSAEWTACRVEMIEQLQEAEEWVEREDAIVEAGVDEPPVDSEHGPEFLPSHPTLALLQSAMEEHLETAPNRGFHRRDPKWLGVLYQRLRARTRGRAPFVEHRSLDDFRFEMPPRGRIALVSDWGTGNQPAASVAQQIRARDPDHVIHLGDVYYSGTPREMERNFLGMWRAHGPQRARYWALNANHEMYSGGYGYFQHVLPAFGQPASYFTLQNPFWRLVGLDSAYVNHNFNAPQMQWLEGQLTGEARSILLTHHHLFSPFRRRGEALEEWLDPHFAAGRVFGWYWGHDHSLLEFADHRGVKCRCIGHGSLPYVPPDRRRPTHQVQVVRMETRPSPVDATHGIHGFALLTFDGPELRIEYVDEEGGTSWTEQWTAR
jgi:hypothetical protein